MTKLELQALEQRIKDIQLKQEDLEQKKRKLERQVEEFEETFAFVNRQVQTFYNENKSATLEEDYQITFQRMNMLFVSMEEQFQIRKEEIQMKERTHENHLDEYRQQRRKMEMMMEEHREKEEKKYGN